MSVQLPEFQRFQYAFTAHIRNPKAKPVPPGIDARRMRIYRRLVYENLEGFLLRCFPVTRGVLGSRRWSRLVRAFLIAHRSRSPLFHQIAGEFIEFLGSKDAIPENYPVFLLELAHYEWVELALSTSTGMPDWKTIDTGGNLLEGRPLLNPVLANLCYNWPVYRIRPRARIAPAKTYLLLFRDADDEVQFSEINAFTARLIDLLALDEHTGRAALEIITAESRHPLPEVVTQGGLEIMTDLQARGALLGVARE
ncbi:MAG TPA: putative DNA-binding domain-containing protein [Nitrosospira sp.]|jgi:uncharacterized protein|nr:putative DNA-binding domain-containing protein [Nitrosospira sp.]